MDGSPFPSSQSMASPAASNWPGSPNVPRPSPARQAHTMQSPQAAEQRSGSHLERVLPQRTWAGAVPTLLTHEALEALCTPSPLPVTSHPVSTLPGPEMSPLERFLGCVYMRRQLQRFIQTEETVSNGFDDDVRIFLACIIGTVMYTIHFWLIAPKTVEYGPGNS